MKKLIAYGKDIHGKTVEFDCSGGVLFCEDNQLTELTIPMGVTHVYCYDNQLTELIIPEGVKYVECSYNQITELTIPEGAEDIYCNDNQIIHLNIPESVTFLCADKEVIGLENHVGKVRMDLV